MASGRLKRALAAEAAAGAALRRPVKRTRVAGDEQEDEDLETMRARLSALRAAVAAHPDEQAAQRRVAADVLARRLPAALRKQLMHDGALSEADGELRALLTWLEPEFYKGDGRATRWFWHCRVVCTITEADFEVELVPDMARTEAHPVDFTPVALAISMDKSNVERVCERASWEAAREANERDPVAALAALCFAVCLYSSDFTLYPAALDSLFAKSVHR